MRKLGRTLKAVADTLACWLVPIAILVLLNFNLSFSNSIGTQCLLLLNYILQHVKTSHLLTNHRGFSRAILCPPMEKPGVFCVKPKNDQEYQLMELSKQQQVESTCTAVARHLWLSSKEEQPKTFLNLGSSVPWSDTTTCT